MRAPHRAHTGLTRPPHARASQVQKELGSCTAGEKDDAEGGGEEEDEEQEAAKAKKKRCTHGPDEPNCNKYNWTVVNKGENELVLFQDSKLILHFSNFFSSERCGYISRGSKFMTSSHKVYAPEGLWHYGAEGRSATDGDDQQQKKVAMAERRVVRNGTKGILWGLDRAFTNGSIMETFVAPADTRAKKQLAYFNKVRFCDRWASDVLLKSRPLRTRWPPGLCVQLSGLSNAESLNAASQAQASITEHEPIDMSEVASKLNVTNPLYGRKRHRTKTATCKYDNCPHKYAISKYVRAGKIRCGACGGGKGWFYHLPCFVACHRITRK